MKLSSVTITAAATLLLAACNSLDNPISNLFHHTSHDERVYNPQTGEWEWPPDKRAAHAAATPAPQGNDTRYWDAQRNQWVEKSSERTATAPSSKPAPSPTEGGDPTPAPVAPAVPPPRPARATGIYNASTGKIEWQSGGYVPTVASTSSTPAPKKHWWWPF